MNRRVTMLATSLLLLSGSVTAQGQSSSLFVQDNAPPPPAPNADGVVPNRLSPAVAGVSLAAVKLPDPRKFAVNDLVWTHVDAPAEFPNGKGWSPINMDKIDYAVQGLDLKTGELRKQFSTKDIFSVEHHHRCYRNKITERFLMASRRGVEFVDLNSGANDLNHWVRSGCLLGNLPCNGLLYVAPHDCGCYMETKLSGFNALAPAGRAEMRPSASRSPMPWPSRRW